MPDTHLQALSSAQTIMPHTYIHRHEKPPISWTSISMSKKREAVQTKEKSKTWTRQRWRNWALVSRR